jgi:hypothetical protein
MFLDARARYISDHGVNPTGAADPESYGVEEPAYFDYSVSGEDLSVATSAGGSPYRCVATSSLATGVEPECGFDFEPAKRSLRERRDRDGVVALVSLPRGSDR